MAEKKPTKHSENNDNLIRSLIENGKEGLVFVSYMQNNKNYLIYFHPSLERFPYIGE